MQKIFRFLSDVVNTVIIVVIIIVRRRRRSRRPCYDLCHDRRRLLMALMMWRWPNKATTKMVVEYWDNVEINKAGYTATPCPVACG